MEILTATTGKLVTLYEEHRVGVQAAVAALLVSTLWRPTWRFWWRQWEQHVLVESPKVLYQATTRNEHLLARCVTMTKKRFYPRGCLFNGHLQTATLAFASSDTPPAVRYERQTLDMPDGGIISLDWALPTRPDGTIPRVSSLDKHRPTLLILPGLTGDSSEVYIRCLVNRMLQLGWQIVVMNARGCGNTPLKSPRFFCSAYTDDMRFVLHMLDDKYGFSKNAGLMAAGFSMGANVVVKLLGEEGDEARGLLNGAISVGNPFDLVKTSRALTQSLLRRWIYDATLLRNVKRLFFIRTNAPEVFRDHAKLKIDDIPKAKTVAEFDDCCTSVLFNYKDADDYYRDASSASYMSTIRVPLLCLNANDDPIAVGAAVPYDAVEQNENVILCVTKTGGHLAYYGRAEGDEEEQDGGMWSVRVVSEFAESVRLERGKQ